MRTRELDLDSNVSWYVNEVLKYFPGVYTFDELNDIIHDRVKHIYCAEDKLFDSAGEYLPDERCIHTCFDIPNEVLFHEFTHALRSYYFQNDLDEECHDGNAEIQRKFHLADEGMTEYITKLYLIRRRRNNNSYTFFANNKDDINTSYELASGIYSMLNALTLLLTGKDFVNTYLKGENIYSHLYEIVYKYVSNFDEVKSSNEIQIMALRISNIILTYLADLGEEFQLDDAYNETLGEYILIEKFIKNFLYSFYFEYRDKRKILEFVGNCLLYERPITPEDRLLSVIWDEKLDVYSYEDLETIVENFSMDDYSRN